MIPVRTITLVLSIVCLVVPAWADDKVSEDAYDRGDYATAWHELLPLAVQSHAVAQVLLACSMTATGIMSKLISSTGWRSKAGAVLREHVVEKMPPAKIAEAQKLAQEWQPKGK